MQLTFIQPTIISLVFALVVATVAYLIKGLVSPWPWRDWLRDVWVFFCFCFIILFGVIRV